MQNDSTSDQAGKKREIILNKAVSFVKSFSLRYTPSKIVNPSTKNQRGTCLTYQFHNGYIYLEALEIPTESGEKDGKKVVIKVSYSKNLKDDGCHMLDLLLSEVGAKFGRRKSRRTTQTIVSWEWVLC